MRSFPVLGVKIHSTPFPQSPEVGGSAVVPPAHAVGTSDTIKHSASKADKSLFFMARNSSHPISGRPPQGPFFTSPTLPQNPSHFNTPKPNLCNISIPIFGERRPRRGSSGAVCAVKGIRWRSYRSRPPRRERSRSSRCTRRCRPPPSGRSRRRSANRGCRRSRRST